jgi:hypothetical protein
VRTLAKQGGMPNRDAIELAQAWDHRIGRFARHEIAGDLLGKPVESFKHLNDDERFALEFVLENAPDYLRDEEVQRVLADQLKEEMSGQVQEPSLS